MDGLSTVEACYGFAYTECSTGDGNGQVQVTLTVYEWSGSDWVWKASGLKNYYDSYSGDETLSVSYEFGSSAYRFVLRTQTNFGASDGYVNVYTEIECGEYKGYFKVYG